MAGISITITAAIRAFSCCSGVGNISNEPVKKYNSPNRKTTQTATHKINRSIFMTSPPWGYYSIKAVEGQD